MNLDASTETKADTNSATFTATIAETHKVIKMDMTTATPMEIPVAIELVMMMATMLVMREVTLSDFLMETKQVSLTVTFKALKTELEKATP